MSEVKPAPSEPAAPAPKVMNRGLVVVGAVLIQLCLGAIYAWSVFTPPLKAKDGTDVVAVYGAAQLGLEQDAYDKLMAELERPQEKRKAILARIEEIKAKTDGDKPIRMKTTAVPSDEALQQKHAGKPRKLRQALAAAEAERFVLALIEQCDTDPKKLADGFEEARETARAAINERVKATVPPERLEQLTYGFNNEQTQWIFSAGLAAFAVVMVLAGRMMPKTGPRFLAIAGGVVLGAGYVLAGVLAGQSFRMLLVFIGLVGGAGIGLGYVVPIAVGMKWFPDKKGMITGLAVAGFGFGALLWIKLAGSWGNLIADLGLGTTFAIYGVVFFLMCLIGSLWMKNPPEGWLPEGYVPPEEAGESGKPALGATDFTSGRMLATPQFYMIFLCFVFGAGAGLMSIGLMKAFPTGQLIVESGLDAARASAVAGTAMAIFFSLANGIGRIVWGTLSDKLGRKLSIFLMLGTQGVLVICFQWMAGTPGLLYLGAALIGFNFGGNFALFPTITADTFGTKYIGQNYAWVFLAYGVGGILGPIMGGKLGDLGNFPLAFTICGVFCLVAAVIAAFVRHPKGTPAPAGA
jgi:OFA family oxalate/formate antiporter-like MFS transporter